MNLLYLECNMGAAGDMLMGALYDLLDAKRQREFLTQMNSLGLPGVTLTASRSQKCGIYGAHMHVSINGVEEGAPEHAHEHEHEHAHEHEQAYAHEHEHTHAHEHGHEHDHEHEHGHAHEHEHEHEHAHEHEHEHAHTHEHEHEHEHHHASYSDILQQIAQLPLPEEVRTHAAAVYRLIGDAEAKAHQTTMEQIHFHEVGTIDAVTDVVGCCLLIHMLKPDTILASPVHVGSGTVHCAHGILPVPAPATAEILKGVPVYGGQIQGELCTPTGAALLKHFADSFTDLPLMAVTATGYGMGTKDFPQANCVRAFLGTINSGTDDTILSLSCNLDDITGEALAFATEQLMAAGALDVYTTPIFMKKGRPGQLLTCLCRRTDEERMTELIFRHTTTRGIRVQEFRRHVLSASFEEQDTPYGKITIKRNEGYGVAKTKPEYDDLARIAREQNISLEDVWK